MVWTIVACSLFIVVGLGTLYLSVRRNRIPVPQNGLQWLGAVLSLLLICLSGVVLGMILADPQTEHLHDVDILQVEPFGFTLVNNQQEHHLSDYAGSVVLLNFWATWCGPCIAELPDLDALQRAYASEGLVVMTITDEPLEDILRYADLLPEATVSGYVTFESLPESIQAEISTGRPVSYVIDRSGTTRSRVLGAGNFAYFEGLVTPWLAQTGT